MSSFSIFRLSLLHQHTHTHNYFQLKGQGECVAGLGERGRRDNSYKADSWNFLLQLKGNFSASALGGTGQWRRTDARKTKSGEEEREAQTGATGQPMPPYFDQSRPVEEKCFTFSMTAGGYETAVRYEKNAKSPICTTSSTDVRSLQKKSNKSASFTPKIVAYFSKDEILKKLFSSTILSKYRVKKEVHYLLHMTLLIYKIILSITKVVKEKSETN